MARFVLVSLACLLFIPSAFGQDAPQVVHRLCLSPLSRWLP